jgi:hypothetical protein
MPTEVEIIFIRHAGTAGDQGALICIPENPSSQMNNEEPDWQGGDNKWRRNEVNVPKSLA